MQPPTDRHATVATDTPEPKIPTRGMIVAYILRDGRHPGEVRPAIVVKVGKQPATPYSLLQLAVFTDGQNFDDGNDALPQPLWCSKVERGDTPGTWHFLDP